MVQTLRDVWRVHYARDGGRLRWRSSSKLPPVVERVQSTYDPEAHFSMKRDRDHSLIQAGFRHRLAGSGIVLDLAAGAGLNRDTPHFQVAFAVQWALSQGGP
jgi:hypothetical protein